MKKKKTLIFGSGVMGSYLGACLYKANHKVYFLSRRENYKHFKKNGLFIETNHNEKKLSEIKIIENQNAIFINNLGKIKKRDQIDYIFITCSINENLIKIFNEIERLIGPKTLIITPCTSIPFWWYVGQKLIEKKIFEKKLNKILLTNIKRENIVAMTMWLSGKKISPGRFKISHIQRGYPIKEVFEKNKKKVDILRNDLRQKTMSPIIKDIYFESFSKSINSLAFNLIALKYNQNNFELKNNKVAVKEIFSILTEGDIFLKKFKIKIIQSSKSRINQTLKSNRHTMSMLTAMREGKKIELTNLVKNFEEIEKLYQFRFKNLHKIYSNYISSK